VQLGLAGGAAEIFGVAGGDAAGTCAGGVGCRITGNLTGTGGAGAPASISLPRPPTSRS